MTKKEIKILALKSFVRDNLDSRKVKFFVKKMTRRDLRTYIRTLKELESKKKIIVFLPSLEKVKTNEFNKQINRLFPNKKIVYEEDPNLLLGTRILNNDLIYDFNLKNTLENMAETIGQ